MAILPTLNSDVFIDTSFVIARINVYDQFHQIAEEVAPIVAQSGCRMLTTAAVIFEIGNALSRRRLRVDTARVLRAFQDDDRLEIISVTDRLFSNALNLYAARPDKEWSLTDCASFLVMQDRQITQALTTDVHFEQAGFTALLRQ